MRIAIYENLERLAEYDSDHPLPVGEIIGLIKGGEEIGYRVVSRVWLIECCEGKSDRLDHLQVNVEAL